MVLTDGTSGVVTHRYLQGPAIDQVLAEETTAAAAAGAATNWLLSDHQQSVRDVIDNAGVSIDHIVYDSFGNIDRRESTTYDLRFAYTGRELANESGDGLYYYRRRFYDSANGRFINQDPIGFTAGDTNLYRYVGNSPLNFIDPTGLRGETAFKPSNDLLSFGFDPGLSAQPGPGVLSDPTGEGVSLSRSIAASSGGGNLFNGTEFQVSASEAVGRAIGTQAAKLTSLVTNIPAGLRATKDLATDVFGQALLQVGNQLGFDNGEALNDYGTLNYNRLVGLSNAPAAIAEKADQIRDDFARGDLQAIGDHFLDIGKLGIEFATGKAGSSQLKALSRSSRAPSTPSAPKSPTVPKSPAVVAATAGAVARNRVAPSNIRFSQPTISQNLSSHGTINDLVSDLRSGKVRVDDVPAIRVVERNGQLITLDNRRLAAFQTAGVDNIPIQRVSLSNPAIGKEFREKFNPINGGRNIVVMPSAAERGAAKELLRQHGKIN